MKINYIKQNQTFKGIKSTTILRKFVESQEPSNLKYTRFFQDVATNWVPKAVLTRSKADFSEMTFLEFTESALFYFVPESFGKFFRKSFSIFSPKKLRGKIDERITERASDITKTLKEDKETSRHAITKKAAIILACTAIPAGEY